MISDSEGRIIKIISLKKWRKEEAEEKKEEEEKEEERGLVGRGGVAREG